MTHDHHDHVNGHPVSADEIDDEALDAYEERLKNEAIVDQVKVASFHQTSLTRRRFLRPKKYAYQFIASLRGSSGYISTHQKRISPASCRRNDEFWNR